MTIISVDVRGELRVDGEPKKVADLTQEFFGETRGRLTRI